MKKTFLLMVVVALAVPAFALEEDGGWDGNRRMAATVNFNPLLMGAVLGGFGLEAGFEYAPVPFASARVNVRFVGFDPLRLVDGDTGGVRTMVSLLRLNMDGRWYPGGDYVRGWFFSGGLQYQRIAASASFTIDGATVGAGVGFGTVSFFTGVGHKLVFRSQQRTAFAIEAAMDLGWRITCDLRRFLRRELGGELDAMSGQLVGWLLGTNGPRFHLLFGAAF